MIHKKRALIISCFDWYKSRLEPIQKILQKKYDVTILLSDYDHIRKNTQAKRYPDCSYLHVPAYYKNISIRRIWSHFCFGQAVNKRIKKLQPDLIYLILPPNYTAFCCLYYCRTHPSVYYYIDLIDLWPESFPNERFKGTFLSKFWSKLRDDSIREADHVFVECDFYIQKLCSVINDYKRVTTLHLFQEQSLEEYKMVLRRIEDSKKNDMNHISIAYLGSINNIVDIDGICNIIRLLTKNQYVVEVRIVGNGEKLEEFLASLKAENAHIYYYGEIYNKIEKIKILGNCDYGINMMKQEISVGLTIKSVDYLSMGIPLLNNIPGDTWELVEKEGIGINIGNESIDSEFLQKPIQKINRLHILNVFNKYFSKKHFIEEISAILLS